MTDSLRRTRSFRYNKHYCHQEISHLHYSKRFTSWKEKTLIKKTNSFLMVWYSIIVTQLLLRKVFITHFITHLTDKVKLLLLISSNLAVLVMVDIQEQQS